MHAYLLIGRNTKKVETEIDKLVKKLRTGVLEFPLAKIADVRELNSFTKLAIDKRTTILIKDIDTATVPALNAFLKNLEEPQENLFYILTCANKHNLPPTIVSRCQEIRILPEVMEAGNEIEAKQFAQMDKADQLLFTSKIRSRDEAINFVEKIIFGLHLWLIKSEKSHLRISQGIRATNLTLNNLRANGNVQLQLTNFVLSLV